jgi:hypothetical protein
MRKYLVDYESPVNAQGQVEFKGSIEVDSDDELDAEEAARAKLVVAHPSVPDDEWAFYSTTEVQIPRPSEEQAEEVISTFLEAKLGSVPYFILAEDGLDTWSFWIKEDDTTSYLHSNLRVEWYGTSWEPGDVDEVDIIRGATTPFTP